MSEDQGPQAKSTIGKIYDKIKAIGLILLILFAIAPILFAAIPNSESNQTFSIYSESYDGLSVVRTQLENTPGTGGVSKYGVTNIISNLNVLNRFNGSGVLLIVGPASNFDLTETISVILFLLKGGSVIIVDDFGTGNDILDPIFSAFENIDKFAEQSTDLGFEVPSFTDILEQEGEADGDSGDGGDGGTIDPLEDPFSSDLASDSSSSFTDLLGDLIVRFGFNTSGILMDAGSNTLSPTRPLITDIDDTNMAGVTFTEGVNKVQLEFASIISIKLKISTTEIDEFGEEVLVNKTVWQPLQKLSTSLLNDQLPEGAEGEGFELSLPFFPLYSSKLSWIETNSEQAADGVAEPDIGEWGNAKFATALSLPLGPLGKLVFLSDPSIFINRWTAKTTENDNLKLIENLVEMASSSQEPILDENVCGTNALDEPLSCIPIIFDFGHTYQGLTSPALYSTALMKLIAQLSMFPLYAPFVPFAAYGYGKRLMPKSRRLRPILLTKRRGEKGHSDFERKLEEIKDSGGYGEPIMHLSRRLLRNVQSDIRFTGTFAKNPREMANFFVDNYPGVGSRRELRASIAAIFKIAEHPTRRMSLLAARKYLTLLKKLIDLLE
ncbi:MAG: hypothetical protein ACXAD7_22095 [Candidatus Kariarchaeaceae archaeon]|jgi:hypothetical protein